jgi:large subunit ribosomal protein L46
MVGKKPIGLYKPSVPAEGPEVMPVELFTGSSCLTMPQTLVFFYKMHILAGQVEPNGPSAVDFAWLTKEEIKGYVDRGYWRGIKDMLSDS